MMIRLAREFGAHVHIVHVACGEAVDATRRIIRYGFVELFDDVSWWLALGIVLSAVVVVAIPTRLFDGMWGGGIASMV